MTCTHFHGAIYIIDPLTDLKQIFMHKIDFIVCQNEINQMCSISMWIDFFKCAHIVSEFR